MWTIEDDANKEVVNRKLDRWIEDKPKVAENRVRAILAHPCHREIKKEPAALIDAVEGLRNRPNWAPARTAHGEAE